MAAYTIKELYNGENDYCIMSRVSVELMFSGPYKTKEDEDTAIEMAYVKHTILVLREMERNGDTVGLM